MPRCGDILPEGVICGCCHSMSHCGTSPKSLKNLNGCSMNPKSLSCGYLTNLSHYGNLNQSLTMSSAITTSKSLSCGYLKSLSHCGSSSLTSLCGCPKSCCGSLSQSLSKCLGLW